MIYLIIFAFFYPCFLLCINSREDRNRHVREEEREIDDISQFPLEVLPYLIQSMPEAEPHPNYHVRKLTLEEIDEFFPSQSFKSVQVQLMANTKEKKKINVMEDKHQTCDNEKDITQVSLEEYKTEGSNEFNEGDLQEKHCNLSACESAALPSPTHGILSNTEINKRNRELIRGHHGDDNHESFDIADVLSNEVTVLEPSDISHDNTITTDLGKQEHTLTQDEIVLGLSDLRRSLSFSSVPSELHLSPNSAIVNRGAQKILGVPNDVTKPASNESMGNEIFTTGMNNVKDNNTQHVDQLLLRESHEIHLSGQCSGVSDNDFWRDCEREGGESPRDQQNVTEDSPQDNSLSTRLGFLWQLPSISSTETTTPKQ